MAQNTLEQLLIDRQRHIAAGATTPLPTQYPVNQLAAALHPETQYLKITKVVTHDATARSFYLAPDPTKGTQHLAYFQAGQYLSVRITIDGSVVTRPYAIRSAPQSALNDEYILTIKRVPQGFVTPYIFNHWRVGTTVTASAPMGTLTINPLRDQSHIVAIAGGSGITPFYAMASAILDGTEDADLTILYGSRDHHHILLGDELNAISTQTDRVHLVNVLSDEDYPGYETGFITADVIRRHLPAGPVSVFICGPDALYQFAQKELTAFNLPAGRIRHELSGNYGDPRQAPDYPDSPANASVQTFRLTVSVRGQTQTIPARADESVLTAMERAGIHAPSACRSGECGVCRARVVSGQLFVPNQDDHRRLADKTYGYVHTCLAFPLSDCELDVPVHALANQFG